MLTARHVAIFSRPPIPREVKTQLIPVLGADGAAALYQRLLRRTLRTVCNTGCPRSLWIAGDPSHPMLHAVSQEFAIALRKQRGANLSAWMKHTMRTMLVETDAVAIVNADCPILDAHHLEQRFAALRDGAEVAAIPAEDGGYVAICVSNAERARLNAVLDALFDNMPGARRRLWLALASDCDGFWPNGMSNPPYGMSIAPRILCDPNPSPTKPMREIYNGTGRRTILTGYGYRRNDFAFAPTYKRREPVACSLPAIDRVAATCSSPTLPAGSSQAGNLKRT
ncbi:TIGR04282 family arsenosugar biosynthesis glycosyltransferase [Burkholderia cenocepacia]|jgi:glycosyltransferase A (GT-A) superfamily protein (DUF2064 family)